MKTLSTTQVSFVSGANQEVQNVGYAVGYFTGAIASGISYTFGGGAGYRLGIAIYNVTHSDD